ncbi:MAG: gliding motility-associated C-terminal domain-containing protein [Bacteroidota bacterium]
MNRTLLLALLIALFTVTSYAQIEVQVVVNSGTASSDCSDPFGGTPDPLFAVAVEGGDYSYYPEDAGCFNALPHTPYQANFSCPSDLPMTVEVCLQVFDNDAFFPPPLSCDIVPDCQEILCNDFVVPPPGSSADYNLMIDMPGTSSGSVDFTIETAPSTFPDNDLICNAVDLGTLVYGDTLGDMTIGNYSNACATNTGEPNPQDLGYYFTNEQGVWFRFNTGPNPSGQFVVEALSDPEGTGDPIDLELGVFLTDNGACDGNLVPLTGFNFNNTNSDFHDFRLPCPLPNTDYYILIDGTNQAGDFGGIFGLQVWDVGVPEGGDLRCDVIDLGLVPEGGAVSTMGQYANFCATDIQDPFLPTFVSQHSVWFSFIAPPSGHVIIEGISDTIKQPLGVQLALYRSFNNTCTGFFSFVTAQFTPEDLDEVMEVTCLFPGRPYFILVDGSGSASRGIFELSVTDAGDITPITDQDLTICAGETITVGPSTYNTSGVYADTLQVFQGCDSIVNTTLTVLEDLVLTVEQTQPAIGADGTNGIAVASAEGGLGDYTFTWCTGETGTMSNMLVAGEECCVQVVDENGCMDEVCFTVEFTTAIIPTFQNDTLACNGDTDGVITFSIENGVPPYDYTWTNSAGTLSGGGQIVTEAGTADIPNLPADSYTITANDNFFDTMFTVLVVEPELLFIELQAVVDASCFSFCDGSISTSVSGGTPPYTYVWTGSSSTTEMADQLCAGAYQLLVRDANDCEATLDVNVDQPAEFIVTASMVQEVSCFGGMDGIAQVTDNGNSVGWEWSSGSMSQVADNLLAGTYEVIVQNGDGCLDTTTVNITEPNEPLGVSIAELTPISCFGAADGVLVAAPTGPFASLSYDWSTGGMQNTVNSLDVGTYTLLITNEKGCEATANYTLDQPSTIMAETFAVDINCVDGPNAGAITVENVDGGTPGYTYGLQDQNFGQVPLFEGLTAGSYSVVIRDAAGCELLIPTTILPPPDITVELSGEDEVKLGDEVILRAITNSQNPLFTWSHADTLVGDVALLRPTETLLYEVTVLDTVTLCSTKDIFRIFVDQRRQLHVPNVFSPNGDGSNDSFTIFAGNDVVNIRTLRVFSRGGQLVFENENLFPGDLSMGWDGSFNGELLNPGVFVFFAEVEFFDGKVELFQGDVTLIR